MENNVKYAVGDKIHWMSKETKKEGESVIVEIFNTVNLTDLSPITSYIINVDGLGQRLIHKDEIKYKIDNNNMEKKI